MAPSTISSVIPALTTDSGVTSVNSTHASQFSLSNKTIAITGGGRGLGITLAAAVLEAGGHVACLDVLDAPAPQEWEAISKTAKQSGLKLTYHHCDVTDDEKLEQVFKVVEEEAAAANAPFYGAIACAGIQQRLHAIDYPAADFERILRVNTTGAFLTAKHAAKVLIRNKVAGSILLIASMSGQIANRGLTCTAYNTSKGAVQQMCRSVAQEWGQYGIRVNTLSPGYIQTSMLDQLLLDEPHLKDIWMAGALLGRLGVSEDFKAPAVFLLSPGSSFMTGADLRVDGGNCAAA